MKKSQIKCRDDRAYYSDGIIIYFNVQDEKQEGKRQLEATHRQMESFQQLIAELREKKNAASQVQCFVMYQSKSLCPLMACY